MDERLKHNAPLVGYRHVPTAARVTEIAVYADGTVKKIDKACRDGFLAWQVPDADAFLRFNKQIPRV